MEDKPVSEPKPAAPIPTPVMDVVPPPATPAADKAPAEPAPTNAAPTAPAPAVKLAKPVTPKQPSDGVGMAIAATVIIVLGLAILAVIAYLKTAK